jgi:hypothetical protein
MLSFSQHVDSFNENHTCSKNSVTWLSIHSKLFIFNELIIFSDLTIDPNLDKRECEVEERFIIQWIIKCSFLYLQDVGSLNYYWRIGEYCIDEIQKVLKPLLKKFEFISNSETLWTKVLEKLIKLLKISLKILKKLI